MVKLMLAKLFPEFAKIPGGNYFTINGQTGGLENSFLGKPLIWQLHIEVSVSTNYILNIAKHRSNNTLAIILWRETNDKDLDKNESIITMETMNNNRY